MSDIKKLQKNAIQSIEAYKTLLVDSHYCLSLVCECSYMDSEYPTDMPRDILRSMIASHLQLHSWLRERKHQAKDTILVELEREIRNILSTAQKIEVRRLEERIRDVCKCVHNGLVYNRLDKTFSHDITTMVDDWYDLHRLFPRVIECTVVYSCLHTIVSDVDSFIEECYYRHSARILRMSSQTTRDNIRLVERYTNNHHLLYACSTLEDIYRQERKKNVQ
jgi:hypothetical protein